MTENARSLPDVDLADVAPATVAGHNDDRSWLYADWSEFDEGDE